jgi:hypothetical protein
MSIVTKFQPSERPSVRSGKTSKDQSGNKPALAAAATFGALVLSL